MENTENKTRGNAPKDVMCRAPEEKREGKAAKSEENENFPKLIEDFPRCERSKCSERSNGSHAKGMTPSRRWKKGVSDLEIHTRENAFPNFRRKKDILLPADPHYRRSRRMLLRQEKGDRRWEPGEQRP